MTIHIGYGGTPYDSKAEAAASFKLAALGCIPAKGVLSDVFTDADGTEFSAKADFYHPGSRLFIEYKCATLNGCKTKKSADKQLAKREGDRCIRGQRLMMIDRLKYQWNHARRKQAIVQCELTPQNFLVVFDKPPTLAEAWDYVKAGIVFVPLSALPSYLGYARFLKLGLQASFQLHYYAEEVGPVAFTLGPFDFLRSE